MHNHNMLEVNNLSKNFAGTGRETEFAAVDGISFTLDAGECLGLIGESGCGKSTTARLITGLVQADAGSVLLEGEEILGRKGRRQREVYRKIQMVFQTPQDSFDPMQTLETGILEAFRNQGMSRKEACLHLPELLKKVELSSETAMRYPRETSGGECQRAAIARALAVQPSLLICDEATSALDAAVQAQIVQLLKKLQREEGLAMLWIGHDLALVRELCSRVIVMRQGNIVEQGETREVLEYPKEEYIIGTAEKVGNMPDRTVYNLSEKGKDEFISTLKASILQFNYDTNIFSIAAFFLNTFTPEEQQKLLQERLTVLQKYRTGIEKQVNPLWENEVSATHSANVKRMIDLVDAEITGTNRLLESCNKNA